MHRTHGAHGARKATNPHRGTVRSCTSLSFLDKTPKQKKEEKKRKPNRNLMIHPLVPKYGLFERHKYSSGRTDWTDWTVYKGAEVRARGTARVPTRSLLLEFETYSRYRVPNRAITVESILLLYFWGHRATKYCTVHQGATRKIRSGQVILLIVQVTSPWSCSLQSATGKPSSVPKSHSFTTPSEQSHDDDRNASRTARRKQETPHQQNARHPNPRLRDSISRAGVCKYRCSYLNNYGYILSSILLMSHAIPRGSRMHFFVRLHCSNTKTKTLSSTTGSCLKWRTYQRLLTRPVCSQQQSVTAVYHHVLLR